MNTKYLRSLGSKASQLALISLIACSNDQASNSNTESTDANFEVAAERLDGVRIAINNTSSAVNNALDRSIESAENIEQRERDLWQRVVTSTPELVDPSNRQSLLSNPTSEFLEYLALWENHPLGVEPLYQRGILNRDNGDFGYERYMDLDLDYDNLQDYILGILEYIDLNPHFNEQQKRRFTESRLSQLQVIDQLRALNNSSETDTRSKYLGTPFRVSAEIESRESSFINTAFDPNFAIAIMMKETIPNDLIDPNVRLRIMMAMLQSGFNPSYKLSTSSLPNFQIQLDRTLECLRTSNIASECNNLGNTQHLVTGFPHFTFNTVIRLLPEALNRPTGINGLELELRILRNHENNVDSIPVEVIGEQFAEILGSPDELVRLFNILMYDNLGRFEQYSSRNLDAINFLQNENNKQSFVAITAYFNNQGGTANTYQNVINLVERANFNQDNFLELLFEMSSYSRDVLNYYNVSRENESVLRRFQ